MFSDWYLCTGRCAHHSDSQMFSSDALHIIYNEKLKNSDRYNRHFAEPNCVESTTGFRYPVFASFKGHYSVDTRDIKQNGSKIRE